MSAHTPGPWMVASDFQHHHGDGWGGYWQIDGESDSIACNQYCYANRDPKTSEANARLIAAAPEMLDALRLTERALTSAFGEPTIPPGALESGRGMEAIHAVRAAVAKATGAA